MTIRWICSLWGMEEPTMEARLSKARKAGFDGIETGVPADPASRRELGALLKGMGLALVAQQHTTGADAAAHMRGFEEQYRRGVELAPLFVNSHTGRDIFGLAENLRIFAKAEQLEKALGVQVMHEIHRGRPTFSVPSTLALLDALPGLRLTADFSHWCCVHESLLEDQAQGVSRAVDHCRHIHARVGHAEAPQVTDPRAPEWKNEVAAHLRWWQAIVDRRKIEGTKILTICPEFGPPGYMATLPGTGKPVADLWAINTYMKDFLKERLLL